MPGRCARTTLPPPPLDVPGRPSTRNALPCSEDLGRFAASALRVDFRFVMARADASLAPVLVVLNPSEE